MKRYKFLREVDGKIKSNSGNLTWKIGKQKIHRGKLDLCESGLHCSKEIQQAFSFVQGEVLAVVECEGKHLEESDKEVWQKMTIVKAYKWQKKDSVALAIYAAELVIDIFEKECPSDSRPRDTIKAAKRWLKNPTQKNIDAAWSAAASAAESAAASAAESAAASAAWSARSAAALAAESAAASAGSAAWSARSAAASAASAGSAAASAAWSARSAAASAAESAAWSAICKKIETFMVKRLKKLESIN